MHYFYFLSILEFGHLVLILRAMFLIWRDIYAWSNIVTGL